MIDPRQTGRSMISGRRMPLLRQVLAECSRQPALSVIFLTSFAMDRLLNHVRGPPRCANP